MVCDQRHQQTKQKHGWTDSNSRSVTNDQNSSRLQMNWVRDQKCLATQILPTRVCGFGNAIFVIDLWRVKNLSIGGQHVGVDFSTITAEKRVILPIQYVKTPSDSLFTSFGSRYGKFDYCRSLSCLLATEKICQEKCVLELHPACKSTLLLFSNLFVTNDEE